MWQVQSSRRDRAWAFFLKIFIKAHESIKRRGARSGHACTLFITACRTLNRKRADVNNEQSRTGWYQDGACREQLGGCRFLGWSDKARRFGRYCGSTSQMQFGKKGRRHRNGSFLHKTRIFSEVAMSHSHSNNRLEPMLRKRLYQCLEKFLQSGPLNAVVKFRWKHAGKINPSWVLRACSFPSFSPVSDLFVVP